MVVIDSEVLVAETVNMEACMKLKQKWGSFISMVIFSLCLCASAPSQLAADPFAANLPKIAMDSNENIYAVWEEQTTGLNDIMFSSRAPAGNWTTPELISVNSLDSTMPLIAVNAGGDVVVIWNSVDTTLGINSVYGAILPFEGSWTTSERVSTSSEDAQPDYQLNIDSSGNIVAIWSAFVINDQQVIRSAIGTVSGGWDAAVQVSGP